jgi:hypothetical protein
MALDKGPFELRMTNVELIGQPQRELKITQGGLPGTSAKGAASWLGRSPRKKCQKNKG